MSLPHSKRDTFSIFKQIALSIGALAVILFFATCALHFDKSKGYFELAILPVISYVLLALSAVTAFSAFFIFRKESEAPVASSAISTVFSLLPGIAALPTAFNIISAEGDRLLIILSILALSPIFFNKSPRLPIALKLSAGFLQAIFIIISIAHMYFDMSVELNNPVKLFLMLASAAVLLSTLGDLRLHLGRCSRGYHVGSKLLASVFCLCGSMIGFFAKGAQIERFSSLHFSLSIFFAAYAIYAVYDLIATSINLGNSSI